MREKKALYDSVEKPWDFNSFTQGEGVSISLISRLDSKLWIQNENGHFASQGLNPF